MMAESEEALPRPNNVVWELRQKENSPSIYAETGRSLSGPNENGELLL